MEWDFSQRSKLTGHRRVHTKEAEQEGFHGQTFPMVIVNLEK